MHSFQSVIASGYVEQGTAGGFPPVCASFGLSAYDVLLIVVVSLMIVCVAYLRDPKWKALITLLPLPSTLGILSLGQEVDASFLIGLFMLYVFFHLIHRLFAGGRIGIVLSIAIATSLYVIIGMGLVPLLPHTAAMFWSCFAGLLVFSAILKIRSRPPDEAGYRTTLPLYVKLPITVTTIFLLVQVKSLLGGFMPMFPMVGVVAAYEARHCLKTVCYQLPLMVMMVAAMFAVFYLTQEKFGLYLSLLYGWIVYLLLLLATRKSWLPSVHDHGADSARSQKRKRALGN